MLKTALSRSPRRRPATIFLIFAGAFAAISAPALGAGPLAYLPAHDTGNNSFKTVDLSTKLASAPVNVDLDGRTTGTSTIFFGEALSNATGMLFISDDGHTESVFQVDTRHGNATVKEYFVGDNPRGMAVDSNGRFVYVALFNGTGVAVIDTTKTGNQAVSFVDFGNLSGLAFAKPYDVKLNLAGSVAYVTDSSVKQRLCRFNTAAPLTAVSDADCVAVGTIPDSETANPNALAVSADGTRVYVVNHSDNSISVVDTTQVDAVTHRPILVVLRSFKLGFASPNGIALHPSGKRGYVGTSLGHILSLDLAAAENTLQSPNPVVADLTDPAIISVQGMSISPDGTRLLAVDNSNALHFINIVDNADTYDTGVTVSGGPVALGEFVPRDFIFVGRFQN